MFINKTTLRMHCTKNKYIREHYIRGRLHEHIRLFTVNVHFTLATILSYSLAFSSLINSISDFTFADSTIQILWR